MANSKMTSANKTSGRAVADIKAVYFRKFDNASEPTIAASLLADENWFAVASLRGSVNINQDDVSVDKILIDQSNMPIGITTEPGDFTFEAFLPLLASEELSKWLNKDDAKLVYDSADGKHTFEGYGYTIDGEVIECSVLIQTRTNDTFIFPRAMVSVAFQKDDKVFGVKLAGQVLGASNAANKDVYVLADHTGATGPSQLGDWVIEDETGTVSVTDGNLTLEGEVDENGNLIYS